MKPNPECLNPYCRQHQDRVKREEATNPAAFGSGIIPTEPTSVAAALHEENEWGISVEESSSSSTADLAEDAPSDLPQGLKLQYSLPAPSHYAATSASAETTAPVSADRIKELEAMLKAL